MSRDIFIFTSPIVSTEVQYARATGQRAYRCASITAERNSIDSNTVRCLQRAFSDDKVSGMSIQFNGTAGNEVIQ